MSPAKSNNYTIEFSGIHQKHLIYSCTPRNMKYNVTHQKIIKYTLTGTHHSIYNTMSPTKKPLNTHRQLHTIKHKNSLSPTKNH